MRPCIGAGWSLAHLLFKLICLCQIELGTQDLDFFIELSLYIARDINIARDQDLLFNSNIAKNLRNHFDFLYQQNQLFNFNIARLIKKILTHFGLVPNTLFSIGIWLIHEKFQSNLWLLVLVYGVAHQFK
jgi:hypothetical protein